MDYTKQKAFDTPLLAAGLFIEIIEVVRRFQDTFNQGQV
jgi:hypothetical protein